MKDDAVVGRVVPDHAKDEKFGLLLLLLEIIVVLLWTADAPSAKGAGSKFQEDMVFCGC
jgi:hypothetical protein